MTQLNALPTEPLLDESFSDLARYKSGPELRKWIGELASERDPDTRSAALYGALRKQLGQPTLIRMLRTILGAAVRNEFEGAAALTALLGVRASGELLISRVGAFGSLRRLRHDLRLQNDHTLEREEKLWLRDLLQMIGWLRESGRLELESTHDAQSISKAFATLFDSLVQKSDNEGVLGADELVVIRELSRIELRALERRASILAGKVDPYSPDHMRRIVPILAEIDSDVRHLGEYLDRMEEEGSLGILAEHVTVMGQILNEDEEKQMRHTLQNTPELQLGWRLVRGLDRNPMPQRTLAWFAERILLAGDVLHENKMRSSPLDITACALMVLDHYRDGKVMIPSSGPVVDALRLSGIENIELPSEGMSMVLDRELARRLPLPYGMPLPRRPLVNVELYAEEEAKPVSVKEMVMDNLNNISVLLGLLKNQKVTNTPGIVGLVAQRSRNIRVLEVICNTRALYSGFANKDVPIAILRSPMNIPIKTLRKFIQVRYVSKIELKRLEVDRSSVRREVAEEIRGYLRSLR